MQIWEVIMKSSEMIKEVPSHSNSSQHNIDFSRFEEYCVSTSNEIVTLYHGSKSGIQGSISPISRKCCDFGKGFYMGTDRTQPLLIAYNRGKMESIKNSQIYTRFANLSKCCDMIIGSIANDRMFVVLDRFFNGEITDFALINSLSALKLGKQYVALTEKACKKIKILDEQKLSEDARNKLKQESEANRSKGIAMADEICRQYRREGLFFDEILEAGK